FLAEGFKELVPFFLVNILNAILRGVFLTSCNHTIERFNAVQRFLQSVFFSKTSVLLFLKSDHLLEGVLDGLCLKLSTLPRLLPVFYGALGILGRISQNLFFQILIQNGLHAGALKLLFKVSTYR